MPSNVEKDRTKHAHTHTQTTHTIGMHCTRSEDDLDWYVRVALGVFLDIISSYGRSSGRMSLWRGWLLGVECSKHLKDEIQRLHGNGRGLGSERSWTINKYFLARGMTVLRDWRTVLKKSTFVRKGLEEAGLRDGKPPTLFYSSVFFGIRFLLPLTEGA